LVVEIDEISERFFEDLNNPAQSYPRLQPALPHQGHAFGKSKTKSRRQQCCGEFLGVPRRKATQHLGKSQCATMHPDKIPARIKATNARNALPHNLERKS